VDAADYEEKARDEERDGGSDGDFRGFLFLDSGGDGAELGDLIGLAVVEARVDERDDSQHKQSNSDDEADAFHEANFTTAPALRAWPNPEGKAGGQGDPPAEKFQNEGKPLASLRLLFLSRCAAVVTRVTTPRERRHFGPADIRLRMTVGAKETSREVSRWPTE
jgi:hypothetical protein